MESLEKIWREAGYEEEECHALLGELYTKVEQLFSSEIFSEENILSAAKEQVDLKFNELKKLYRKVGLQCPIDLSSLGSNCTDRIAHLEDAILLMTAELKDLQVRVYAEVMGIQSISLELGESFPSENTLRGPLKYPELSEKRIQYLQGLKTDIEARKEDRIRDIQRLLQRCFDNFEELALRQEGFKTLKNNESFEELDKSIVEYITSKVSADQLPVSIDIQSLQLLERRLQSLEVEKDCRRVELTRMGEEIARLWTLLRIPTKDRDNFSASFSMTLSMATLSKGMAELQRLKRLRALNLEMVITSLRRDIERLWVECGVSELQRRSELPAFYFTMEQLDDSAVHI